ncbi:MAG: hypothetical protein IT331_13140 [Anaerolineae bacterium]|nr:hypothetical protein [Anaerolineae bacterium]
MQNRILGPLVAAAIILIFLAACGGEPATPTRPAETVVPTRRPVIVPTLPPGWTPYSRTAYQIALPNTWQEVKLSRDALKNTIAAAQESNPPLAEQLRALLESEQYDSFLFYGAEKNSASVVQNVSITHLALEETNDLQTFSQSYADAFPNIVRGSKVLELQSSLRVNGIEASSIVYDMPLVDGAGNLITLRGVQFLFRLESGDAYLVSVTGDAGDADTFMPLARQIATSFVAVTP